eukprot:TRINITY_DN80499_c0_g1_i1.p2 TRINITY_DN80499_c0_g1~~TRINITY_DN80499_c0_g1_i1.p2  ORF type:complete len:162 (+),score=25.77 TRINITY_DN80499_c0_g1_i1:124-609(+)
MATLVNPNPTIYSTDEVLRRPESPLALNEADASARDPIDPLEIFDHIRHINDPEHPLTLEQLKIVEVDLIDVDDASSRVHVYFTPTIPHCTMPTLIGLCIMVKLRRSLPLRFKIFVEITPGKHQSEEPINKQLNDKERVAAAMENPNLMAMVNRCLGQSCR